MTKGKGRRENAEQAKEAQWITEHIPMLECKRFVPTSVIGVCACGRRWQGHTPPIREILHKKGLGGMGGPRNWDPVVDTLLKPTNAFGEVLFDESHRRAKYIRVAQYSDPKLAVELFMKQWGLEAQSPKLLIHVTGGARKFRMGSQKRIFRKSLIRVALDTGAWIVTGGLDSGVMRQVGKAIRQNTGIIDLATSSPKSRSDSQSPSGSLVCIGIAPWGYVHDAIRLVSYPKRPYPVPYFVERVKDRNVKLHTPVVGGCAPLEPYHSHFLLVDDGSSGRPGGEIAYRSAFLAELCNRKLRAPVMPIYETETEKEFEPGSEGEALPAVCVALEGGVNTLRTLRDEVLCRVPIVLVAGSGRITDLLVTAFIYSKPKDKSSGKSEFSKDLEHYLLKKLEEYLDKPPPKAAPESEPATPPTSDGADQKSASKSAKESAAAATSASAKAEDTAPNDVKGKDGGEEPPAPAPDEESGARRQLSVEERRQVEEWFKWMKTVLSARRMVTLYSLHSEAGIDGSILEAVFKSRTSSLHRQLELAIRFNRLDMAHKYVLVENKVKDKDKDKDSRPHVGALTWRDLLRLKPRSPIGTVSRHGVQMLSDDDPLNRSRKEGRGGFYWQQLLNVMEEAISSDRVGFVRTFLESGIDAGDFLSIHMLLRLYNRNLSSPSATTLRALVESHVGRGSAPQVERAAVFHLSMKELGHVHRLLLGDVPYHPYLVDARYRTSSQRDFTALLEPFIQLVVRKKQLPHFDDPAYELFVFCILMNRIDMALLFWELVKNSFAAALVAAKLLRELSSRSTQRLLELELEESAMLFEKLAHRLLSAGELVDGARTSLLVRRPVDARAVQHGGRYREEDEAPVGDAVTQAGDVLYEGRSALPFAHESGCLTILAHGVALKIVRQIWFGRISGPVNHLNFLVLLACVVPPVLYFLDYHFDSDSEHKQSHKSSVKTMEELEEEEEEEAKGCCGGDSGGREDEHKERVPSSEKLCYWRLPRALLKPVYFYTSPVVKFDLHVASYTFFLLLLSYTALVGFYASTFEWQEIVLCLYVIAFLFDEVHQAVRGATGQWAGWRALRTRLRLYYQNEWNSLDLAAIVTFAAGIICGNVNVVGVIYDPATLALGDYETAAAALGVHLAGRVLFDVSAALFWLRVLHMFTVSKTLGAYVTIMTRMMRTALIFLAIMLVFIVCWGVVVNFLLFPQSPGDIATVRNIIYLPFISIFGNNFYTSVFGGGPLDIVQEGQEVNGTWTGGCSSDPAIWSVYKHVRCPDTSINWFARILQMFYTFFIRLLIITLLIAQLINIFNDVKDKSLEYWAYVNYELVREFEHQPPLPAPFSTLSVTYVLLRMFFAWCSRRKYIRHDFAYMASPSLNEQEERSLGGWLRIRQAEVKAAVVNSPSAAAAEAEAGAAGHVARGLTRRSLFAWFAAEEAAEEEPEEGDGDGDGADGGERQEQAERALPVVHALHKQCDKTLVKLNLLTHGKLSGDSSNSEDVFLRRKYAEIIKERNRLNDKLSRLVSAILHRFQRDSAAAASAVSMSDASSESGGGGGRGPHLRTNIAQMQAQVHWAGRNLPYPAPVSSHDVDALTPSRYQVPSSRTSWQLVYQEYGPTSFTNRDAVAHAERHLPHPDPDELTRTTGARPPPAFNQIDVAYSCDRVSSAGRFYTLDAGGYPLNPMGRTGLCGRGVLPRWGPNHAEICIIARFKKSRETGEIQRLHGMPVLELIAYRDPFCGHWSLPFCLDGVPPTQSTAGNESLADVLRELIRSELERRVCGPHERHVRQQIASTIACIFDAGGVQLYRGYWDDARNTDNAWLEAHCSLYADLDVRLDAARLASAGATGTPLMGHAKEQSDSHSAASASASELLHAAFDDADLSPADAERGEAAAPEASKLRAKLRWLELHSPRLLRLAGLDADGLPVSLELHSQPALRALLARVAAATGAYFPHAH